MTPKQIELVENSWGFALLNRHEVGGIFYDKLFEIDPALRRLFASDMRTQSQKLTSLITFVVHKLNNIEAVLADVQALGARHRDYNVTPEHYATVLSALLWTLERCLGEHWNDEVKEAWVAIYTLLSKTMIDAPQHEHEMNL